MYFYKNSEILTANVTKEEELRVKHHFVKFLEIDQLDFNAL